MYDYSYAAVQPNLVIVPDRQLRRDQGTQHDNKKLAIMERGDDSMTTLQLLFKDGHLFVELGEELWLVDTGATNSFGATRSLTIAGEQFSIDTSYLGLTADTLAQFVGVRCAGLLAADILGHFDLIFNAPGETLTVSTSELSYNGESIQLSEFMGIPIVNVQLQGNDYRMFFDTGAQFSYLQDEIITDFPAIGKVTDFYPGIGQFQTDIYEILVLISGVSFTLHSGRLPGILGATLEMASAQGIVGNEILRHRTLGFFPRRRVMVI